MWDWLIWTALGLVILIVAVVLHELAHGIVAYWLGDRTAKDEGRLTLNPAKHLDIWSSLVLPFLLRLIGAPVFGAAKPVPVNRYRLKFGEWGMALVALAGPVTNLVLAFIGAVILMNAKTLFIYNLGGMIMLTNLGLMLFNLLPIPPLDGSKVLMVLLPDELKGLYLKMEQMGIWIIMIILMVFSGPLNQYLQNGIRWFADWLTSLAGLIVL